MNITRDEAAQALADIAQSEGRSNALYGYRIAGPILIVWGLIWVVGYTAMGALPARDWGYLWLPLDIIGILASFVMGSRGVAKGRGSASTWAWRTFGFMVLIVVFCGAIFTMFRATDVNAYLAFPGMITGTIYGSIGLARMPRYIWIGSAMMALTLIGYFFVPQYLTYWMAVTGGGGLIVGGLLMRRA